MLDPIGFISPGGLAFVAIVTAVLWTLQVKRRSVRVVCLALVVAFTLAGVPAVPLALMRLYAGPRRPVQRAEVAGACAVVLLGGGTRTWQASGGRLSTGSTSSAARALEAARVYRLLDRPIVISSGGTHSLERGDPSSAVMRDELLTLGVPADRIRLESGSFTTRDEAVLVPPMLRAASCGRSVLVTTQSHMRRAIAAFRAEGLTPVPAAASDAVGVESRAKRWTPNDEGFFLSRALLHEIVGLVYYRLRGWAA